MTMSYTKSARKAVTRMTRSLRGALHERTPGWAKHHLGPLAAHTDMMLVDHGIFRTLYLNLHALDGQAFRSAQPSPGQLARIARRGVRSVINLRGDRDCGSYWLERRTCERIGLDLIDFKLRSRDAPSCAEIEAANELFSRVTYPILIHCKSGADRAGLMSALYLLLVRDMPIAVAKRQLSLRFGHIRQADTGILDAFLGAYERATAKRDIGFLEWVQTAYDPDEVRSEFRADGMANRLVNGILRRE